MLQLFLGERFTISFIYIIGKDAFSIYVFRSQALEVHKETFYLKCLMLA